MASPFRDLSASVRQRLLDLTRREGRVFDAVLVTYGLERLLYRLSISTHRNSFVLKGGMLVSLWTNDENRVTRDVDFLGHGEATEEHLTKVCAEVLSIGFDDGLVFDVDALNAKTISEEHEYDGVRLKTVALLGKTRVPITVDIGFGDAMTEPDHVIDYPSLLEMPLANVRAYPPVTVVAEKFQTIVNLGLANSRMKDYYDLWVIGNTQVIEPPALDAAIRATFQRRNTDIPADAPTGLTRTFYDDTLKTAQWTAYSASIDLKGLSLEAVVESVWSYLGPSCERLFKVQV